MNDPIAWLWRNVVSSAPQPLSSIPFGISKPAITERVGTLLFLRVREAGLEGSIPRDEQADLARFYSNALRHTLRLLDAAEEFSGALAARCAEPILLKGGAHVLTVYRHPGARPMQDVDLLVRPGDFSDAVRIARDLGYGIVGAPKRDAAIVDSVLLQKGEVFIDLHERLTHRLHREPDLHPFFERAVAPQGSGVGHRAFRVFAPEDAALHSILHIVHHGFSMRLIAFADLARLLATPTFRWCLFGAELERLKLLGVAHVILEVLERNLGIPFTNRISGGRQPDKVARLVARVVNPETGRLRFRCPDIWTYAFVTRPLLDGPLNAARWLLERAVSRLKRIRPRD